MDYLATRPSQWGVWLGCPSSWCWDFIPSRWSLLYRSSIPYSKQYPCYYKSQDVLISCIPRLMDFHPLNSKQNAFMCIRLGPTLHSNYFIGNKILGALASWILTPNTYYYYVSLILVATGRTRIMLILLPCDIAGNYGVSLHLQFILHLLSGLTCPILYWLSRY